MPVIRLNRDKLLCRTGGCLIWHMRELAIRCHLNPDDSGFHMQLAQRISVPPAEVRSLFKCSLLTVRPQTFAAVQEVLQATVQERQEMELAWQRFHRRGARRIRQECCRPYNETGEMV